MKTVVFSDTHLTHHFRPAKYARLKRIIESGDRVIINGDLWDSELTTFDKFVTSEWQQLFPLLLSKNTIYLYGNHDEEKDCDSRVSLFSVQQGYSYELEVGDKVLHIEHGHRIVSDLNIIHTAVKKLRILSYLYRGITTILVPLTNRAFLKIYGKMNKELEIWAANNLPKNTILVCGHSHLAEYAPEKQFIDLGAHTDSLRSYLLIEDDKMDLLEFS